MNAAVRAGTASGAARRRGRGPPRPRARAPSREQARDDEHAARRARRAARRRRAAGRVARRPTGRRAARDRAARPAERAGRSSADPASDSLLEPAQSSRRLDAELLDQGLAGPPVDLERLRLTPAPVERRASVGRSGSRERNAPRRAPQLSDQLDVTAERELGLDPLLERRQADLLQPPDRRPARTTRTSDRPAASRATARGPRAAARSLSGHRPLRRARAAVLAQSLEPAQVELIGPTGGSRSRASGSRSRAAPSSLPSSETCRCTCVTAVTGARRRTGRRRVARPRRRGSRAGAGSRASRAASGRRGERAAIADDLERPEDPELEHPRRKPVAGR